MTTIWHPPPGARAVVGLLLAMSLASCATDPQTGQGRSATGGPGAEPPARGYVIAEEPQAARIGTRILKKGGTPADAATAMALTLSVTYPAAASLGSGGVCLYLDAPSRRILSLDFLPRQPRDGGPVAVPGLVSGLTVLHGQWGTLDWETVVAPAQGLASAGHPFSEAMANRLEAFPDRADLDPYLATLLSAKDGTPLAPGERLTQPALGRVLARLAETGGDDFYKGETAALFLASVTRAGGAVTADDMGGYQTRVRPAQALVLADGATAYIPAADLGAGSFAWAVLDVALKEESADRTDAARMMDLAKDTLEAHGIIAMAAKDFGTTSFLVADRSGSAVACGLTMNGVLGARRLGLSDGIVYARTPTLEDSASLSAAFLTPAFLMTGKQQSLSFAGVGSGQAAGPAAVFYMMLAAARDPEVSAAVLKANGASAMNRAHFIHCTEGLPSASGTCVLGLDPHGAGLAIEARGGPS